MALVKSRSLPLRVYYVEQMYYALDLGAWSFFVRCMLT